MQGATGAAEIESCAPRGLAGGAGSRVATPVIVGVIVHTPVDQQHSAATLRRVERVPDDTAVNRRSTAGEAIGEGEVLRVVDEIPLPLHPMLRDAAGKAPWSPGFVDYLYLAFTNATALSPADTMPLSHRAKLLMMAEAVVSLLTIAIVAARAVNILT